MSTMTEAATAATVRSRSRLRDELIPLYMRSLRVWLRVPSSVIPPLFVPTFFLVVNTSALGDITNLPVFATTDYVAFFLPVSLLMTVASAGSGSGMALVQDMDAGYFDKLLLAPISRTSILMSRLMVDGTRAALQATTVMLVGVLIGGRIETGIIGALTLIVFAFGFGLAYAGIGLTIALRTASAEATQSSFIIFFPLVFLAPTFVPLEFLPGWLETVARINPISYVILAMRALTTKGFVWGDLLPGMLAIALIGAVTLSLAFRALHKRADR